VRSKGSAVLIDTGNHDTLLKEALARQGIFHLDAVLITHADDDHCGSLQALDGVVAIDSVLVARDALTCDCDSCESLIESASSVVGSANVEPLAVGDAIACGDFSLKVIWPYGFSDEGGNADSLCLLASLATSGGTWTALFCGDAESNQLKEIIDEGELGDIDIYKVGHHGSKAALTESVVEVIRPEISLVSVGKIDMVTLRRRRFRFSTTLDRTSSALTRWETFHANSQTMASALPPWDRMAA